MYRVAHTPLILSFHRKSSVKNSLDHRMAGLYDRTVRAFVQRNAAAPGCRRHGVSRCSVHAFFTFIFVIIGQHDRRSIIQTFRRRKSPTDRSGGRFDGQCGETAGDRCCHFVVYTAASATFHGIMSVMGTIRVCGSPQKFEQVVCKICQNFAFRQLSCL